MKYIASCSGGKDSVATLIITKEKKLPLDEVVYSEVMFDADTSGEFPEHRDFIYNRLKPFVETELQVPCTIVRSEKNFLTYFESFMENENIVHGYPIPGLCAINRDCKARTIQKYWNQAGEDVVQYIGIAADEQKRLERLKGTNKVSLLEKDKIIEKQAFEICRSYDLLSPIYEFSRRNGCWFCMNCHDNQWRYLLKNHPELFNRLIELENKYPIRYRECLTRTETAAQIKERIHLEGEQLSFFDEYSTG